MKKTELEKLNEETEKAAPEEKPEQPKADSQKEVKQKKKPTGREALPRFAKFKKGK